MAKERSSVSSSETKEKNLLPLVSILGIVILFIADLYVIINSPGNFIVLAVITILMLLWIFLLTSSILKQSSQQKIKEAELLEELFRGQKANYLQQKKVVEQISDVKAVLGNSSTEDLITAQKALAKVTISRSRENAEALMNSNDKVMEKMSELFESIERNNGELLSQQKSIIDDYIKEMMEKEQEILANLQGMENAIKSEFAQTVDKMNELAKEISIPAPQPSLMEDTPVEEEPELPVTDDILPEESELPAMDDILPEEPELPAMDDILPEEPGLPAMDDILPEELELPAMDNILPEESELPAMDDNAVAEDIPVFEDNFVTEDTPVAEEEARLDSILADIAGILPNEEEEPSIEEDSISIDNILADIPDLGENPEPESEITDVEEDNLEELPSLDSILADIPSLEDETENDIIASEEPMLEDTVTDNLGLESLDIGLPDLEPSASEELPSLDDTGLEELPSLDSILADIPGLEDNLSIDDLPVLDDIPIMEEGEKSVEVEPIVEQEKVAETAVEPETVAEPAAPNKIMTPDEIAALIANL